MRCLGDGVDCSPGTSRYSAQISRDSVWFIGAVPLAPLSAPSRTEVEVPALLACSKHLHGGENLACSVSLQRTLARGLVCYLLSISPSLQCVVVTQTHTCNVCNGSALCGLSWDANYCPRAHPLLQLRQQTNMVENGPRVPLLLEKVVLPSPQARAGVSLLRDETHERGCRGGWGAVHDN